jgi:type II secretory pathway pseudopilin PulG
VKGETGDSLIEVLIAVVIISFCAVAILGALSTTLSSAGEHRSLAADDTLLETMAEQVKNVVELQPNPSWPGGTRGDCPASGSLTQWYQSTSNIPLPSPLAGSGDYPLTLTNPPYVGYVVNLMNAEYWNGTGWQAGCPAPATGVQKVTVSVTSPGHVSDTIDVVVRKQSDGNA